MKFYAICYEVIDGKTLYFGVTCKFLSSRIPITEDFYEELKSIFYLAGRNNNSYSGIYFDGI